MKDLRLLKNLFFFLLLGFSLCAIQACGDDDEKDETIEEPTIKDDEEEIVPSTPKRLVQMIEEEYDEGDGLHIHTYQFDYDKNGKLASVTEYDTDGDVDDTYSISYTENSITCVETDDKEEDYNGESENVTFRLLNGRINMAIEKHGSSLSYTHSYSYNSSNYLVKTKGELGNMTFTWEGDKLMGGYKHVDKDNYAYSLEYDGKTCKGYNPVMVWMLASDILYESDCFPVVVGPELAGFKTTQLPKSVKEGDETTNFTYELYEDGYLKQCMAIEDDSYYEVYTFVWE
ncbi:MAG: hypothetical protein IJ467_06545 [Bacteroidaceae bacterium]|nr:hypothetical protein [Bacteroidaceae bacterium]